MADTMDIGGVAANGPSSFATLPTELIDEILSYFDLDELALFQRVSRRLRAISRAHVAWRDAIVGDDAGRHETLTQRWLAEARERRAAEAGADADAGPGRRMHDSFVHHLTVRANRLAWRPTVDDEAVSWYDEYVRREAPCATSWLARPRRRSGLGYAEALDVCGVDLYRPGASSTFDIDDDVQTEPVFAVGPLSDGSVCVWDVYGTSGRRGAVVQQSAPGLLSGGAPRLSSETVCVRVDSAQHTGYFAVGSAVVAVDLRRLVVVGGTSFGSTIGALSEARLGVPVTVGCAGQVHLYDPRVAGSGSDVVQMWRPNCPPTTPLAIVHMPEAGQTDVVSDAIYATGRGMPILEYDRRRMDAPVDCISSTGSLCGLAWLPHGRADVATGFADPTTARTQSLVACGAYNTKGTLEVYAVGPTRATRKPPMVNRQTASHARLLAVAAHGAQLVAADAAGYVRWFERDGFTTGRRHAIQGSVHGAGRVNGPVRGGQPTDLARTLLPLSRDASSRDNDVLFWTGDALGLLTFARGASFCASDFEAPRTAAERADDDVADAVRRALEQAMDAERVLGGL